MVAPTPELSDDTPIERVLFSIRIQNALKAADLKTVGEVREVTGGRQCDHHDADDCNSHSDQHHRQRPPHSSNRVITLDQNFACGCQGNGPGAGATGTVLGDVPSGARRHDSINN
jgi:hypothetical protein